MLVQDQDLSGIESAPDSLRFAGLHVPETWLGLGGLKPGIGIEKDDAPQFLAIVDEVQGTLKVLDPYTAERHVYRLTDDGAFILYSMGLDRDDDGGRHDWRFGERGNGQPHDGDFVFWPIPDPPPRKPAPE